MDLCACYCTKMSSSESDRDESDESDDDVYALQVMQQHQQLQARLFSTITMLHQYYMTYHDKNAPRTSQMSGYAWIQETLNTPGESHRMFRMNENLFIRLHDLLVSNYDLKSSIHMSSMESLAIFLCICGQNRSNSSVQNTFKHSGETISRKFDDVLHCLVRMAKDNIRPQDRNFSNVHTRISGDRRMWPHFKDCIGAIDGSHILATPPPQDYVRYIGRSGTPTQNVMAVVDFDMRFTYASIGQPGSMHDTSVLFHAIQNDHRSHILH